jgi:hypothetical protein
MTHDDIPAPAERTRLARGDPLSFSTHRRLLRAAEQGDVDAATAVVELSRSAQREAAIAQGIRRLRGRGRVMPRGTEASTPPLVAVPVAATAEAGQEQDLAAVLARATGTRHIGLGRALLNDATASRWRRPEARPGHAPDPADMGQAIGLATARRDRPAHRLDHF